MKIAILSDVHGNLPALQAVLDDITRWGPDQVVVNGDVINRGPNNLACWQLVYEKVQTAGWKILRGNHEEFVLKSATPGLVQEGPEAEVRRFSDWTFTQIKQHALELAALPDRWTWTAPDSSVILATHASYVSNRLGVYPNNTDEELRARLSPLPDLFITAHTHRALTRPLDGSLIVNIGSVGLPFDGDWRASYGRFIWSKGEGWTTDLQRLNYDRDQAIKNLQTSGFLAEAGPFAKLVLVELKIARGLIHRWHHDYQEPFFAGEITMQEAVDRFLDANDLAHYLNNSI